MFVAGVGCPFEFSHELVKPQKVKPCGCCFSSFLLGRAHANDVGIDTAAPVLPVSRSSMAQKRSSSALAVTSPALKRPCAQRSVKEVIEYVHNLGLSHVRSSFQSNAVDGEMLCALSEADLQSELGLTVLQARKIPARLPE